MSFGDWVWGRLFPPSNPLMMNFVHGVVLFFLFMWVASYGIMFLGLLALFFFPRLVVTSFFVLTIGTALFQFVKELSRAYWDEVGRDRNLPFMKFVFWDYLSPSRSTVEFEAINDVRESASQVVGSAFSFAVRHMRWNLRAHPCTPHDEFVVNISGPQPVPLNEDIQGNVRSLSFAPRKAGSYEVSVTVRGEHVTGSPFKRQFHPADLHIKSCLVESKSFTCALEEPVEFKVLLRDRFHNPVPKLADSLRAQVTQGEKDVGHFLVDFNENSVMKHYTVRLVLFERGYHRVCLSLKHPSTPNELAILADDIMCLVLSDKDKAKLLESTKSPQVWYPCSQLCTGRLSPQASGSSLSSSFSFNGRLNGEKNKSVYCYISSTEISVRVSFLYFFTSKVFVMKIIPSSSFLLQELGNKDEFTLSNGREKIVLSSPDRDLIFATYCHFLTKRLGGSQCFESKRNYVWDKLSAKFSSSKEIELTIKRENFFLNCLDNVSSLREKDFYKRWKIKFIGEAGIDAGGLRREFFTLFSSELFSPQNQMFKTFTNTPQGLVHPSPLCSPRKLAHYRVAGQILGKILFEGSLNRPVYVPCRFSRAFLAVLLGYPPHYKFFETDDPQLFTNKIKYVLENDCSDLDLTFSEEENNGGQVLEVPLKPNGGSIPVTESNKEEYLLLLSEYKFYRRVSHEIEAIREGLYSVVPEELVAIFEPHELELLLCGADSIDVQDMRRHVSVIGFHGASSKTIDWFWTVMESFTQEEHARFLQFVTGSSRLPPGGFKELNPKIVITMSPHANALPSSHTCFHQLELPVYDNMRALNSALVTAITEGYVGFENY